MCCVYHLLNNHVEKQTNACLQLIKMHIVCAGVTLKVFEKCLRSETMKKARLNNVTN